MEFSKLRNFCVPYTLMHQQNSPSCLALFIAVRRSLKLLNTDTMAPQLLAFTSFYRKAAEKRNEEEHE